MRTARRARGLLVAVACGVVAVVGVVASGWPAAAQDAAARVAEETVYVEPGAEDVDEAALTTAVEDVREEGVRLFVGVLAEDASGGAQAFGDAVLEQAGQGAVLVLTPTEVGARSSEHDDAEIDEALEAAEDELGEGGDVPAGARAFGSALAGNDGGLGDLDTSGLPGPLAGVDPIVLLVGGVVVLLLLLRLLGGGRRRRHRGGYGRRRRRGGGGFLGGALAGGAAGTVMGNRSRGRRGSPAGSSRSRGGGSRRRGGASRSRGGGSRSRGGGSRRR